MVSDLAKGPDIRRSGPSVQCIERKRCQWQMIEVSLYLKLLKDDFAPCQNNEIYGPCSWSPDDETSYVHGVITSDGLFEGTIRTRLEEFTVESAGKYFPPGQTDFK